VTDGAGVCPGASAKTKDKRRKTKVEEKKKDPSERLFEFAVRVISLKS
jgi:hypothetical protein